MQQSLQQLLHHPCPDVPRTRSTSENRIHATAGWSHLHSQEAVAYLGKYRAPQHCHRLHWCASPPRSGQGLQGVNTVPAAKWNEEALIQLTSISPKTSTIPPPPGSSEDHGCSPLLPGPAACSHITTAHTAETQKTNSKRPAQAELLSSVLVHPPYLSCRSLLRALTRCLQTHHEHLARHLPATRTETH